MIGFINPWMLTGLAALAIPVLIHLVLREDRAGQKFPSLMFVRRIPFETKHRRRIRHRLLLFFRCLALAAIVIGFAAPFFYASFAGGPASTHERDVVILVDRSYSMGHQDRWQRAINAASDIIDGLTSGERASVVSFDYGASIEHDLTSDKEALQSSIKSIRYSDGTTGYPAAFAAASRVLAKSNAKRQQIVLISDMQRSAVDGMGLLPLGNHVAVETLTIDGPLGGNATILDARLAARQSSDIEDALVVRARNTGDQALENAKFNVIVNGREIYTRTVRLDTGEVRTFKVPLVLAADHPTQVVLEVGPDALPADNRHYLVLAPRRPITALVVEPEEFRQYQGVFLEEALRLARSPEVRVQRIRLKELDESRLEGIDVVVLDDVSVRNESAADALAAFINRGGGLFAVAGPSASAVWPGGERGFLPGTPGRVNTQSQREHRMAELAGDHPLWAFRGSARQLPFSAADIATVQSLVPGPEDQVVARLANGMPLLLERNNGAGRALALATTADLRWSSLALEPDFVLFVQNAVAYLAGRNPWPEAFVAGDMIDLGRLAGHLSDARDWRGWLASRGEIVVETPSGGAERIRPSESALFSSRRAGIYEAHRGDGSGSTLPFAINPPRSESLFAPISPIEFEARIERRGQPGSLRRHASIENTNRIDAARWLLVIAGIALILESILANRLSMRGELARAGGLG